MSISKKFYNSFTELKSVKSLAMIAMLLALRIILGFIGNSTLPFFGNNVKLSGAFLPIAITGSMFGPVPAMIVGKCHTRRRANMRKGRFQQQCS